jgi:hypothetical protein
MKEKHNNDATEAYDYYNRRDNRRRTHDSLARRLQTNSLQMQTDSNSGETSMLYNRVW